MTKLGLALYLSIGAIFAVLILVSLWLGIWLYAILAAAFGVAFSITGWLLLTRAGPSSPPPRRRPVRRRG